MHAYRTRDKQCDDLVQAIDTLLSTEFVRATQFFQQPGVVARIASQAGREPREHLLSSSVLSPENNEESLEDELMPLVLGLRRTDHLAAAIRLMRSSASEEVKSGIRQVD